MKSTYEKGSLSLLATVAMGTGVMIGAGIFALTGQVAEYAGPWFPLAFLLAAIVSGFSAYSYVVVSRKYPSAGGIAMILHKAYGPATITGAAALLMAFSMIINESLVARTFATYLLRLMDTNKSEILIPIISVGLIIVAFLVNISGNKIIGRISLASAIIKVGGILVFALLALWAADFNFSPKLTGETAKLSIPDFLAATALAILAYKGFTTITNSGDEVQEPKKNVGRSIILSMLICLAVYLAVSFAVSSTLSVAEIVKAKDYSLAEAARPAIGEGGVVFTVIIALIATASGLLASTFAVSRMLAMLTDMNLIPHSHFGMPGGIQKHTLVYTLVLASLFSAFFDLSRIASMGAIFYLLMDMIIHWGVFRHLRRDVAASASVLVVAMVLDTIMLSAFILIKGSSDPLIIVISVSGIAVVFAFERFYLSHFRGAGSADHKHLHH